MNRAGAPEIYAGGVRFFQTSVRVSLFFIIFVRVSQIHILVPLMVKNTSSIVRRSVLAFLLIFTVMSFSACTNEDEMAEYAMMGDWRIVEVSFLSGYDCPYRSGDRVSFYENRTVEFYGSGGFREYGVWRIIDTGYTHELHISFDNYNTDIVADMSRFSGDYARLDVTDYYYDSRYTLRLVRW